MALSIEIYWEQKSSFFHWQYHTKPIQPQTEHKTVLSWIVLSFPWSYMATRRAVSIQRMLNGSIAFTIGTLGPISPLFLPCFAAFFPSVAKWVPSWKHRLFVLIISSLVSVSVEIPFTCQSSNSTTSFVLFFVIKTPVWRLDSGLTDRGGECGEDGVDREVGDGLCRKCSEKAAGVMKTYWMQIRRGVKLNSSQGLQKNAQKGDWNSNMHCILCYDSSML